MDKSLTVNLVFKYFFFDKLDLFLMLRALAHSKGPSMFMAMDMEDMEVISCMDKTPSSRSTLSLGQSREQVSRQAPSHSQVRFSVELTE